MNIREVEDPHFVNRYSGGDSKVLTVRQSPSRRERFQIANYILASIFIAFTILTCFPLNSCSKPEKSTNPDNGIDPDEVLAALTEFPPILFPPETPENAQNEGFLLTVGHCQDAENIREMIFKYYFRLFADNTVTCTVQADTVLWWRTHPYSIKDTLTLKVTYGDTLRFRMDFIGPLYTPPGSSYREGWVAPKSRSGFFLSNKGIIRTEWKPELGHAGFVQRVFDVYSYVICDSTYGGGWLCKIDDMLCLTLFDANWDTLGHGTWWAMFGGEGKW